jgi:hypothetical protein
MSNLFFLFSRGSKTKFLHFLHIHTRYCFGVIIQFHLYIYGISEEEDKLRLFVQFEYFYVSDSTRTHLKLWFGNKREIIKIFFIPKNLYTGKQQP